MMRIPPILLVGLAAAAAVAPLTGCEDSDPNMRFQPKYPPYAGSSLFPDGAADRPLVAGVVSRTPTPWEADAAGQVPQQPPTTAELLARGQERFNIYCSMCHGRDGYGRGMVVMRGYPAPPSLHDAAVRDLDDRHYYTVITGGLGKMPPYAQLVQPPDRWAIVAYVRALQLSQNAPAADVPPEQQAQMPVSPELPKGPMRQP